ncbi:MAG: cobalt transporter CbiM, partial [Thermomicrobiaceae bacterium]|nr:cobalt transporter CbiM [Thermomicrobiaceae bacterium]
MHIPDGYISPATAVALYGAAAPFWYAAGRKVKRALTGQTVPLLAIFSAFTFTIMMFNIPVPGGTTAHAVGGTLAAIVLGPWAAVIAVSVALVIQALFFGDGGITAIGANCFNMAVVLPMVGYAVYALLSRGSDPLSRRRVVAGAVAGYLAINAAGLLVALELGIQPIFWTENGRALYAPYPLSVTIP